MADVVGIYNSDFVQILRDASPLKADINESSKVFEHPIETGSIINDHKIINPIEIDMLCLISSNNYRNVYEEIRQLHRSNSLFTVQTRTGSYPNMTISKMPHDESSDISGGIFISISFKESFLVEAQYGSLAASSVRDPSQSSTIARGEQLPGTPSESAQEQGSFLYRQFAQ